MTPKEEIRKNIKSLCEQNKGQLSEQSVRICQSILASPQYKNAEQIFAYMALADEVDLGEVIKAALRDGKKVALPKIMDFEKGLMQFFYLDTVQTLNSQTQAGTLGISEPDPQVLQPADANTLKDSSILILDTIVECEFVRLCISCSGMNSLDCCAAACNLANIIKVELSIC